MKSEDIYRSRKTIIIDNFLAGISWGIGTVIGATVVVALIGYILSKLESIPFLGEIVSAFNRHLTNK